MNIKLKEEALEHIEEQVLFGFDNQDEIVLDVLDIFYDEKGIDRNWIKQEVSSRIHKHLEASKSWNSPTDFERLLKVFDRLNSEKIVALHKAGYTRQDAESDCLEVMKALQSYGIVPKGYCYYHSQDLARAITKEGSLCIGYDSLDNDDESAQKVVERIVELLESEYFHVDWSGSLDIRIEITEIDWKKLPDNIDYNYGRILEILGLPLDIDKKKPFWRFW